MTEKPRGTLAGDQPRDREERKRRLRCSLRLRSLPRAAGNDGDFCVWHSPSLYLMCCPATDRDDMIHGRQARPEQSLVPLLRIDDIEAAGRNRDGNARHASERRAKRTKRGISQVNPRDISSASVSGKQCAQREAYVGEEERCNSLHAYTRKLLKTLPEIRIQSLHASRPSHFARDVEKLRHGERIQNFPCRCKGFALFYCPC